MSSIQRSNDVNLLCYFFSNKKETKPLSSSELGSRSAAEHHKLTRTRELIHPWLTCVHACQSDRRQKEVGHISWKQNESANTQRLVTMEPSNIT